MSCPSCSGAFSIYAGDVKTMSLKAVSVNGCSSDPLDLTSCTEIVITLPGLNGAPIVKKLSLTQVTILSPAVLGKFTTPITALNSAALNPGELQSFDVTFTIAGKVFTVKYANALSVFEVT